MSTEIPPIEPDEDWVSVTSKLSAHIRTFPKADAWWADGVKVYQTWELLARAKLCYITKTRYVMDAFIRTLDWKNVGAAHQISSVSASLAVCVFKDLNKPETAA